MAKLRAMELAQKNLLADKAMKTVDTIVLYMVKRFGHTADKDEIRSYALLGLADAIERYDPEKNIPIGTFASARIKGAIYDGLTSNKRLPRRLARKVSFYRRCDEMISHQAQLPPPGDRVETVDRLASTLRDLASAYVVTSLDEEQLEEPDDGLGQEELIDRKNHAQKVRDQVTALPENQRTLVTQFFFEDRSLSEIAKDLGHTPSWASRSLRSALRKMRRGFVSAPDWDTLHF